MRARLLIPFTLCAALLAVALPLGQGRPPARPLSDAGAGALLPDIDGRAAYPDVPTDDPVGRLAARLTTGSLTLAHAPGTGYLPAVLAALGVPVDSQLLVFSKTSLQAHLIGPHRPRALYFGDGVAVGYIPGSDLLEFASQDAHVGTVFYTLRQSATQPAFERRDSCLTCHITPRTLDVPGMLAGSVAATADGFPLYGPVRTPDHRTPFRERWGGWYVTGEGGALRHLGRTTVSDAADLGAYPQPHSDLAALLVFEHQAHLLNLLTRLGRDWRAGAPRAVLDALVVSTVDYLLFVDEAPLEGPVRGSSAFAERFAAAGPVDHQGRSLRELDLETRLLRYPCSYLIYSPSVDALPDPARSALYSRLWAVLSGQVGGPRYARLSPADRRAIVEILLDTRSGLPPEFHPL